MTRRHLVLILMAAACLGLTVGCGSSSGSGSGARHVTVVLDPEHEPLGRVPRRARRPLP